MTADPPSHRQPLGDKVGTLEEFFRDEDTQKPEWAVIKMHEEQPVVEKRTVPKERVVRKERIEAEGDIDR